MDRTGVDLPALHLESVARLAVRHPDSTVRDLLVHVATHGRLTTTEVLETARSLARAPHSEPPPGPVNAEALCWFALVVTASADADSLEDVCDLLRFAHHASGRRGLPTRFRDLWLDVAFLTHRTDEVPYPREDEVLGSPGWRVRVDELNPALGASSDTDVHLTALSEAFTQHGLAPLRLRPGAGPPLSRLTTDPVPRPDRPTPLITVVMPVYDPGADLAFSLRSVLAQSWEDIEVLICDDGSPASSQGLLEELAASDPRVQLLRQPVNHGAYPARNLGLARARGEFITFQDADDWSHPERLRVQVEPLLAVPPPGEMAPIATMSHMVKLDDELALTVPGYPAHQINASSLLFRREAVLDRLGGFDSVRRAGDNEFIGRLRAAFGDDALLLDVPEVLALVQRTPGSLSRSDQRLLFRDPSRELYRFCYRQWHGRIRDGAASPFVPPPARPPVPARPRVAGGPPQPGHRADIILLGGFTPGSPTAADITTEVQSLCDTGAAVALVSYPSPIDLTVPARRPADPIIDLIRTGAVAWVLPDESVTAPVAILRDPAAVLHLEGLLEGVAARTMVLVAGDDPTGRFDPAEIEAAVRRGSATAPTVRWLPATPTIAAHLTTRVPPHHVLPPRAWAAVPTPDPSSWDASPERPVGTLRPSTLLTPAAVTAWAETALPRDPDTTLWCRSGGPRLPRRLGRPVASLRGTGTTQEEFLRQIAYLCVPPVPGRGAHLHTGALRALAHGCIPVLEPTYREHFGPAALYADERSIDEWITLHAEQPHLYVEQQQQGARFLAEQLSASALQDTLRELLSAAASDDWPPPRGSSW